MKSFRCKFFINLEASAIPGDVPVKVICGAFDGVGRGLIPVNVLVVFIGLVHHQIERFNQHFGNFFKLAADCQIATVTIFECDEIVSIFTLPNPRTDLAINAVVEIAVKHLFLLSYFVR